MNNYILPFLWVHGEEEEIYRKMIGVIYDADIRAFCVEARPHPDFCQNKWWQDMRVILDEAKKRGMKVWILDDKHFPTGFANGAVKVAPLKLKRRTVFHKSLKVTGGKKIHISLKKYIMPNEKYGVIGTGLLLYGNEMKMPKKRHADELLTCVAYGENEKLDLSEYIREGALNWTAPAGNWEIEFCCLTYDSGMHRDYINMIDEKSCRLQIDAVYEPHFEHFKEEFGTTIAGFFSDEPELGNGMYHKHYNYLGTDQSLPYSDELAKRMENRLGKDWKLSMPLLWIDGADRDETARVRYIYMDIVTRLVEECFSKQIGIWCREHGVQYIGHVIEDNNQHARTSTSLGHFFRGLKWQTMAGIDDIGGQVYPDAEDKREKNFLGMESDGEFYHFALGKLGSSLGLLNPNMAGRTMCEIFGNYGWSEGVQLQKYLLDHFMVRGVNHFVPHAFTCSDYPDKDCPPHFYAQGHNPLYRHFGRLMRYTNRVCGLISEGKVKEDIAIIYHGEGEWTGKCMLMQKPGRLLAENQTDFVYMPSDVFEEAGFYQTEITDCVTVNGLTQKLIIVPYMEYIPDSLNRGLARLIENGGHAVFIDALPAGAATGEELEKAIGKADVVSLDQLMDYVAELGLTNAKISPMDPQIRVMEYQGRVRLFYLVNESSKAYKGSLSIPGEAQWISYDPWDDTRYEIPSVKEEGRSVFEIDLFSHESLFILEKNTAAMEFVGEKNMEVPKNAKLRLAKSESRCIFLESFAIAACDNLSYPELKPAGEIRCQGSGRQKVFPGYETINKKFSGIISYERYIEIPESEQVLLEITKASEGVEVKVNGKSAGIQILPPFIYDITKLCQSGKNKLEIEVATTLDRERGGKKSRSGITGQVNLYVK